VTNTNKNNKISIIISNGLVCIETQQKSKPMVLENPKSYPHIVTSFKDTKKKVS
jgi:hypothetical protein